ncbi:hypothetical protein M0R19_01960 [Candidatus Pacearchaeota archaeon]|nr:hypothetical protein [Candidatus Pacearchaeota archaeon]
MERGIRNRLRNNPLSKPCSSCPLGQMGECVGCIFNRMTIPNINNREVKIWMTQTLMRTR